MQNIFFEFSPPAAAFFSVLLFSGDAEKIAAVIFAVAVHEVSHLLVLALFGCHISAFSLGMNGLCIEYLGNDDFPEKFFSNIAGPLGGFALYFTGELLSCCTLPEWFELSCRISLFLSFFNIMPIYPLDGGHAAGMILSECLGYELSAKIIFHFGMCYSVFLLLAGLVCTVKNSGVGVLAAGIWLLRANILYDGL